ncbi:hypothetical protein Cni_G23362 [Canna indica]|uniref:Uncharacterized protein n=1 Tax=Canna indica TaxID=4628 RepID=A0AAQ3L081_9LILI|nr:hypothetical protein Cni_G23362 [Canna indica]
MRSHHRSPQKNPESLFPSSSKAQPRPREALVAGIPEQPLPTGGRGGGVAQKTDGVDATTTLLEARSSCSRGLTQGRSSRGAPLVRPMTMVAAPGGRLKSRGRRRSGAAWDPSWLSGPTNCD